MPDSPPNEPTTPPVLVLVRDLLFSSRITATARASGTPVLLLRDPEALSDQPGRRLIVDLNQPGALESATAWKQTRAGEVIGFVSHVDGDTIRRARAAGIDRVMARSQFVQELPELLSPPRPPDAGAPAQPAGAETGGAPGSPPTP